MRLSIDTIRRFTVVTWLAVAALVLSTVVVSPAYAADALHDPIPTEPVMSSLGLVLTPYATFPRSTPTPAPDDARLVRGARINTISEVPDGSGRLAVPDLNGNLYFVRNGVPTVYMNMATMFPGRFFSGRGLGQGMGYVAFDPDFRTNGYFYTMHTELVAGAPRAPDYTQPGAVYEGVIDEWQTGDPSADTFLGDHFTDHREVLRIGFNMQIHGIQEIGFNPTSGPLDDDYGLLYLAVGDGGVGVNNNDPQNLKLPHGKILRIDPRGTNSPNGRYGLPSNNPFIDRTDVLNEIYAIGFRDPHRFSWDPATKRMYLGHIGEHAIESIDEIRPGDNFGWSKREGPFVFDNSSSNPCDRIFPLPANDSGFTYPVAAYDHNPPAGWNCTSDLGVAVAGGYVYRGAALPALTGKYIFGDLVDGRVFYTEASEMNRGGPLATIHQLHLFDAAGNSVRMQDLSSPGSVGDPNRVDLRFGTDAKGELYLLAKANGKMWKVTGTKTFADGPVGTTTVTDTAAAEDWAPITPSKWQFTDGNVILAEAGATRPGPRRPNEYAVLTAGPEFSSVEIKAQVKLDAPVNVTDRDVVIVFGYQSDTQFDYVHLSSDNTILAHNGIFKVNNADRARIDYQWNGRSRGANPAITDGEWHDVTVRYLPATGEIAVYVDGSADPLMTARDSTFGTGRIGFGSFDNTGSLRNLTVTGTPVG